MKAVDTNVLVRLLTFDDKRQTAVAELLFSSDTIWIAKTVLLETAWVVRKSHGFENEAIASVFEELIGLDNVVVEDEYSVAAALELIRHGIDPADAMHLISRPPGSTFVSFDRSFVRRARRAGIKDVEIAG